MANKKIIEYIKSNIDFYPINKIRLQLLKADYPTKEINEAVAEVEGIEQKEKFLNIKYKKEISYLMISLLVVGIVVLYLFYLNTQEVDCGIGNYNKVSKKCEYDLTSLVSCPGNTVFSKKEIGCVYTPSSDDCEVGSYNPATGQCEFIPLVAYKCAENTVYNANTGYCEYTPRTKNVCDEGEYNPDSKRCEIEPDTNIICPDDTEYNSDTENCEKNVGGFTYTCDIGTYNETTGKCEIEPEIINVCPDNSVYNSETGYCEYSLEVEYQCSVGAYDASLGKCVISVVEYVCTEGELTEIGGEFKCVIKPEVIAENCGDKICDSMERRFQSCSKDCEGLPYCGDGSCGPAEDSIKCPEDCQVADKKCSEQNGNICSESQSCTGSWLSASDTDRCCSGECQGEIPTQSSWSEQKRLTNDQAITTLSKNNAHNLAIRDNKIFLIFGDSRNSKSDIFFKYSNDLGKTWSEDIRVTDSKDTLIEPSIAVGSNDKIHVVWQNDGIDEIYYISSSDGGLTWNEKIMLSEGQSLKEFPDVASDGDYVYATWMDKKEGNFEIYFRRSTDNGKTWEPEQRLTNCKTDGERPSLTIGKDGTIHIVWYDWCDGPSRIFYSYSKDKGITWSDVRRVTDKSSISGHPYLLVDKQNKLHLIYVKGNKPLLDVYYISSPDGITWQDEIRLNSETSNSQSQYPKIEEGEDTLIAVWYDQSTKSYYYKTSNDSGKSWSSLSTITTNNKDYASPSIAADKNERFHIVWEDDREGNREIYYMNGYSGGTLSGTDIFPELSDSQSITNKKFVNINTDSFTEKASAISPDGLGIYYFSDKDFSERKGPESLYSSSRGSLSGNWGSPSLIIFKDASGKEIDISRSQEVGSFVTKLYGKEVLFFAMSGNSQIQNYGFYDIYVSFRNPDGSFGQPVNLGSKINTGDDEIGPSVYFDDSKGKGIIFYSLGWKSNDAHKALYPEYRDYLAKGDENIWFNTFTYNGNEFVFDNAKFFKYNTIGAIEDNPEISSDGKVIFYNGGYTDPTPTYSDLEFAGDFDIYYTSLKDNNWVKPQNIGGGASTSGHEGNPSLLLIDNIAYLYLTYSNGPPYQFDLYDYYMGKYEAPVSSGDVFDDLPEMKYISDIICGDNKCEGSETVENCPNDCNSDDLECDLNGDGEVTPLEEQRCQDTQPPQQDLCGDGTCGPIEKEKGICPDDCTNDDLDCDFNGDGIIQPIEEQRCNS